MSVELNKAAARRWSEELWGRGHLAVADEIIATDYVRHDPGDPFPAHGPDDVKRIVSSLRTMLPDFATSRLLTLSRHPSVSVTSTRCKPRGFGRCGDRVLNTPSEALRGSPRG
jgi:hypothetical protein